MAKWSGVGNSGVNMVQEMGHTSVYILDMTVYKLDDILTTAFGRRQNVYVSFCWIQTYLLLCPSGLRMPPL